MSEAPKAAERTAGPGAAPDGAVVVGRAYDLVLWLLPKVEKFPRSYRFSVGERMTEAGLDLLVSLAEAAYSRDKAALLRNASRKVNVVRLLLRLAKDLRVLPEASYRFATERLDEIGRMLGGWLRSLRPAGETA